MSQHNSCGLLTQGKWAPPPGKPRQGRDGKQGMNRLLGQGFQGTRYPRHPPAVKQYTGSKHGGEPKGCKSGWQACQRNLALHGCVTKQWWCLRLSEHGDRS